MTSTNVSRPYSAEAVTHRPLTTKEIYAIEASLQDAWGNGVWSAELADLDRLALAAVYGDEGAWLTHHARRSIVTHLLTVTK